MPRAIALVTAVAALAMSAGCDAGDGGQTDATTSSAAVPAAPAAPPAIGSERAPDLPVARTEVSGAAWGQRVVVLGGLLPDGSATDAVDVFDPASGEWASAPALPAALHHAGLAQLGGRLYAVGGYSVAGPANEWRESAAVFSLGEGDSAWREEPSLGRSRGAPGVTAAGDMIVVFGGVSGGQPTDSVELLRAGSAARPGPPLREAREHTAAAASGSRVYAIAGRTGAASTNKTSVEVLDLADAAAGWQPAPALTEARGGTSAATLASGIVCVTGGETATETIGSVECLGERGWETVGTLEVPRHGLAVVAIGDAVHVVAGGDEPGLTVTAVHERLVLRDG